jgi:hypothetical protein
VRSAIVSIPVASAPTRGNAHFGPRGIQCPSCVIGDTGTGIHIVGRDKLAAEECTLIDDTGPSVRLNTANGLTTTQDRINVISRALGGQFEAVVLKTSQVLMR